MHEGTWIALALFAVVSSITPGPNNLMLLASGARFGFRSTIPHMLGISSGFCVMVLLVGLGLADLFARLPWVYDLLRWVGAAYLLYLAWRIARSAPPEAAAAGAEPAARPLGFLGAAAFQWVNPKAWVMAVSALTTYVPATGGHAAIAGAAVLFAVINLPCVSVWALFGVSLRRLLGSRHHLRIFNTAMAALLVISLYPVFVAP